ncbi:MAG: hypothetical protein RG741_08240 [Bacteroidales bacterium]|nr:hypothetical protein [Bacteroidales bacterium]
MKTQTKLRKKSFTIVERAMHEVRGFRKLYEELMTRFVYLASQRVPLKTTDGSWLS